MNKDTVNNSISREEIHRDTVRLQNQQGSCVFGILIGIGMVGATLFGGACVVSSDVRDVFKQAVNVVATAKHVPRAVLPFSTSPTP